MKSLFSKSLLLLATLVSLSAFTHRPGGEGFEIFLGQQLMVQRFGNDMNAVQPLSLQNQPGSQLFIKYYHCGTSGTSRVITVKNSSRETLHQFRFPDSRAASGVMMLPVAQLYAVAGKNAGGLELYYSSAQLKEPRLLTLLKL